MVIITHITFELINKERHGFSFKFSISFVKKIKFFIFFVFVHFRQYIGDHIKCITDKSIPAHVINSFCFFTPTFTVVSTSITILQLVDHKLYAWHFLLLFSLHCWIIARKCQINFSTKNYLVIVACLSLMGLWANLWATNFNTVDIFANLLSRVRLFTGASLQWINVGRWFSTSSRCWSFDARWWY